jgi:hypothetical protein
MKYRRNKQGTDRRKGKISANLKIKALEHKLTSNRITWYGYVLRKNKDGIQEKVLNMELNGKCQTGRSRWEQKLRKHVIQKEEITWVETKEEETDDQDVCEITNI